MRRRYKILGISGSPRKGNTDFLLDEALRSIETQKEISTETIYLRERDIRFCTGCFRCYDENSNDYGCQIHRDSMDEIFPKLVECQGLIIATPVYFAQVSAQMKAFMDRTEPLLRYAKSRWRFSMKNKVGGAIAMGGNRNGGQEAAMQAIHHFFLIHDMIIVGTGPDEWPGCYLGAAAMTYPQKGSIRDAVKEDELGLRAARIVAKRVAEVVRLNGDVSRCISGC